LERKKAPETTTKNKVPTTMQTNQPVEIKTDILKNLITHKLTHNI
jgi:hypothetical protein